MHQHVEQFEPLLKAILVFCKAINNSLYTGKVSVVINGCLQPSALAGYNIIKKMRLEQTPEKHVFRPRKCNIGTDIKIGILPEVPASIHSHHMMATEPIFVRVAVGSFCARLQSGAVLLVNNFLTETDL